MHLTIISGAARAREMSNTAKIIAAFCKGFQNDRNTVEIWYLSDRNQWDGARDAFQRNKNILFALPLYVENVPGIMLEFLESLPLPIEQDTQLFFLVQGGFPETSQSRCCEKFLKTLPEKMGCRYGGTFIRGDMFGIGFLGEGLRSKIIYPFIEVGRSFSQSGRFDENTILKFSNPEYLSKKQIMQYEKVGKHIQKWFVRQIAKRLGCKGELDAQPYI